MGVRGLHSRLKESLSDRLDLVLENLALRHQLMVCERGRRLRGADRLWWCVLSRFWPRWRDPLTLVQPATVLRWRRMAWRRHLRGQRRRRRGRPRIDGELQVLIQLWGANMSSVFGFVKHTAGHVDLRTSYPESLKPTAMAEAAGQSY